MSGLDASDLATMRARADYLAVAVPESSGEACNWQEELAAMVEGLIQEIERRDRAALTRWNSEAELGPLFRQKGPPA